MTEREALLAAVCAHPDDDTPRLVFADWLEENGEPERAEFIRMQIELAGALLPGPRRSNLVTRTLRLLGLHQARWQAELPEATTDGWYWRGHFERGFMQSLCVFDFDEFKRNAEKLFASTPIINIDFPLLLDPGALATIDVLSHARHIRFFMKYPSEESVMRLLNATNLNSLEQIAINGPTIDFALEDLIAERFGEKLRRNA